MAEKDTRMGTDTTAWRLDVAGELIDTLSTLTEAGQRHTMDKIVRVLADAISGDASQIGVLERDLRRVAPDVEGFSRRARAVISALGRTADGSARGELEAGARRAPHRALLGVGADLDRGRGVRGAAELPGTAHSGS
jgi:hypothetical protein